MDYKVQDLLIEVDTHHWTLYLLIAKERLNDGLSIFVIMFYQLPTPIHNYLMKTNLNKSLNQAQTV